MSMSRTRVRHDRFTLRGWEYAFHELRDQGKMAALVPETDEPRTLKLFSGREVEIRKGDVAIIYPQIGWPLPGGITPAPVATTPPPSLARAAEAVKRFKEAAATPQPQPSTVESYFAPAVVEPEYEPDVSQRLLVYRRQGESLRELVSRLTPELEREFNKLTQLQLWGAGLAILKDCHEDPEPSWAGNPLSVSERHGEISALLNELQRLGAEAEAKG